MSDTERIWIGLVTAKLGAASATGASVASDMAMVPVAVNFNRPRRERSCLSDMLVPLDGLLHEEMSLSGRKSNMS